MADEVRDMTTIGARRPGVFGAFHAGMRGASVPCLNLIHPDRNAFPGHSANMDGLFGAPAEGSTG